MEKKIYKHKRTPFFFARISTPADKFIGKMMKTLKFKTKKRFFLTALEKMGFTMTS